MPCQGWPCPPARTTRLVLRWMKNSTYSVLSRIVSTVKKSHATIPSAWARRNCVQLGPVRRGAGPRPCRRSSVLIVVAPTRTPSLRSSPQIRTQPHREFSLAIRTKSSPICGSIGGLPGLRLLGGPLPSDECAVPAQQRLGRDEQRCPPLSGECTAGGGEQDPVACGEPGAAGLAAQYPKLMPQYQDLQVLGAVVSVWEDQQAGE